MAATLNTRLDALMFSSQVPDISISVTDDNEAEIMLDVPDMTIFSAVHFPYGHNITIHDLRSVIEYYLRDRNTSIEDFQLRAVTGGTCQLLATFQVLYLEQHFTGDIGEFLRNNFLTTMAAKLTSPKATEFLHFFIEANAQEEITYQVVASVYGGEPRIYTLREDCGASNSNRIKTVELTCEMLTGIVESPANGRPREAITLHAYSVHAGQRAFTFYVQDHEPPLSLYFRNAFNVYERCDLQAVTTHKPKSDRSIAVTHRLSTPQQKRLSIASTATRRQPGTCSWMILRMVSSGKPNLTSRSMKCPLTKPLPMPALPSTSTCTFSTPTAKLIDRHKLVPADSRSIPELQMIIT